MDICSNMGRSGDCLHRSGKGVEHSDAYDQILPSVGINNCTKKLIVCLLEIELKMKSYSRTESFTSEPYRTKRKGGSNMYLEGHGETQPNNCVDVSQPYGLGCGQDEVLFLLLKKLQFLYDYHQDFSSQTSQEGS
jgi:hypothetical protein